MLNSKTNYNSMITTKIPKVIHYIWLGTRPLDYTSLKCMETWKKYLPDYEVKRWGDDECKEIIANNMYASQALEAKKYAFVSDYIRVYVLYHYGGIYMDTDVQIFKNIDRFLNDNAFSCFENATHIPTALMASAKGNKWMKMLLDDYSNREFVNANGKMDLRTNVEVITELSIKVGLVPNGKEQIFSDGVHMYTKDYFCPIDTYSNKDVFTDNTYAAHLFNGSWTSPTRRKLSKLKKKLGFNIDKILPSFIVAQLRKI